MLAVKRCHGEIFTTEASGEAEYINTALIRADPEGPLFLYANIEPHKANNTTRYIY